MVHEASPADPRAAPRPLDLGLTTSVVTAIVTQAVGGDLSQRALAPGFTREGLQRILQLALAEALGAWVNGFTSSVSDGGLVRPYCCARHSLLPENDSDAHATVARVVDAVVDWHTCLCEIIDRFEALERASASMPIEQRIASAAPEIAAFVVERNHGDEAWYHAFTDLLAWYAARVGVERRVALPIIEAVAEWKFHSFTKPPPATSEEVGTEIGLQVAILLGAGPDDDAEASMPPDALAQWATLRETAFGDPTRGPLLTSGSLLPITWDAHRRFIDGREAARDPERARSMLVSLESCRAAACRGGPLTFELLARWQGMVLGRDAPFRTGEAFAKGGRERYGLDAGTRKRFARWLAQADDETTPIHVRAARLYLDVCFVHPFDDGNARAARLALDYVLTRERLVLVAVEPIFTLSRSASDPRDARALASTIGSVLGRAR